MSASDRVLVLSSSLLGAIRRHAAQTYPHECCGALVGTDDHVIEVLPLPNSTEEGPRRRFLIRPQDYRLSEQRASELGLTLLGFYHSHPDHPAKPSQHDLAHAWPTFHYVIVSVIEGRAEDLRSWELEADRSSFSEVSVTSIDQ